MKLISKTETKTHSVYNIFGLKIKLAKKIPAKDLVALKHYLSNEAFAANIIEKIHTKTFPKYKNINKGKSVVIVACGPTMKYYKPIEDTLQIGVNRAYQNQKIKFDYLFAQDYNLGEKILDDIINYPANIFLGLYINHCFNNHIPMKYVNNNKVNLYFSDYPRNLCYPYIEYYGLMDFYSIAFPATQFALYTNPRKIYLVGCDCSNAGYFDGKSQNEFSYAHSPLPGWINFKKYQEMYYPDVEIISVNPVGLKGMFKDVYTQNYLDEHPEISTAGVEILK